jgi:adenylate kinase family enzyme
MLSVLFALGRPGSGKSWASRHILERVRDVEWTRIKDYVILYDWFLADKAQKRFCPSAYKGFDVVDFSVLDEALVEVQGQVLKLRSSTTENELVIIEFARDDYSKALQQFDAGLLKNAYFLFVEAEVKTCIQRIHERVKEPGDDNHFVSDEILKRYYSKDNVHYMMHGIQKEFGIEHQRVKVIHNNDSIAQFMLEVDQFIEGILPGIFATAGK